MPIKNERMKIGYLRREVKESREEVNQQIQRLKEIGCEKVIVMGNDIAPQEDFPLEKISDYFKSGDTLVTIRLSRLCLNFNQLLGFCEWLESQNIALQTLDEGIYTSDSPSPNFYAILKAIVTFKKEVLKEKTLFGLAKARARGRLGGRPKGLSEKANKKADIAVQLYNENRMSISGICTHLSISKTTLYNYLRKKGVKVWKD